MLQRVKDIRYSEIKNWKPIASLRRSYQSDTKFLFVIGLCVAALLMAAVLVSATWNENGFLAMREKTSNFSPLAEDQPDQTNSGNKNTSSTESSGLANEKNTGLSGQKELNGSHVRQSGYQSSGDQTLVRTTVSAQRPEIRGQNQPTLDTRVGIINVYELFSRQLQDFRSSRTKELEKILAADREEFLRVQPMENDSRIVERELAQFKQMTKIKKQMFVLQLQIEEERLLESLLNRVKQEIRIVSKQKRLEVVIRSDRALISNRNCDITDDVTELILGRQSNPIGRSAFGSGFDNQRVNYQAR